MIFINPDKVFKPSFTVPRPIILISRGFQFISHQLTALFAAKLFTTPFNFKTPQREKAMEKSAQKKYLQIDAIGKKIHLLSYGYSKKKVLFVHGWAGRSTQLFMIADKLLEKGYMVISFDGPAHGKSSGKTTMLPEFLETISVIDKEFGPFDAAVGHSFGGMALYNAVASTLKLKSLVTVGSGDKISDITRDFTNKLQVKPIIADKMMQLYHKKVGKNIDEFSPSWVAKDIKIPTLVVHDSLDGDVPVSCAINIRQKLENGELLITHGLGHTKILRDKETIRKIVAFIIKKTSES